MRTNKVYSINKPKMLMRSDRQYVLIILMANVMIAWVTGAWLIILASVGISVFLIKYGQVKSLDDPWWFLLYKPYNRYSDIYVPYATNETNERFKRPYGFGRDIKL